MSVADAFAVRRALAAPGLLRAFNDAGVLAAADVHVARRLVRLAGDEDEHVALAVALAARAPRLGHVFVDLATVRETATVEVDESEEVDVGALPWPEGAAWLERLAASPLVAVGEAESEDVRPLRLVGAALYLDRYWREERRLAGDLLALAAAPSTVVDERWLAATLDRLFAGRPDERQRAAAAAAPRDRLTVIAGGPGTGKTTTVARIAALLFEQAAAAGAPAPHVALAAPTGKAAARLEEAVHEEAAGLDVAEAVRGRLLELKATTLHRALGWRPDSHSRFRHNRANRLPHDAVIVDETSMVSLPLMARLVEAVRPEARLVLVGDPGQLTSIEAGAVLGDIVGSDLGSRIVVLDRGHRFGGAIAEAAEAIRRGDADALLAVLRAGRGGVAWIEGDAAQAGDDALAAVREGAVRAGRAVVEAARAGEARDALAALGTFRVLCAHRRGPHGAATWMARVARWLAAAIPGLDADSEWYAGRPLLVTSNDYGLRLYNGDTGVVIAAATGLTAAFERADGIAEYRPSRLDAIETVYAMTIHKSQGSQFGTAAVVLPDAGAQILTRELLYTAATRARDQLILMGTEAAIRAAVARPVARASGLAWRLSRSAP